MGPPNPPSRETRLPAPVAQGLLLLWWVGIGCFYYSRPELSLRWELALRLLPNPLHLRPEAAWALLRPLAGLAGLAFLGAAAGGLCLRRLGAEPGGAAGRLGFGIGLAWGALGCVLALLGQLRLLYAAPIFAALALAAVGAGLLARRAGLLAPPRAAAPIPRFDLLLAAAIAAFAALNLLGALMPEIFYDALVYHLALPDLHWMRHGSFPTPDNLFSGLPMLIQTLYGLALPLGGAPLAHMIHWAFGLLSALLVYDFGRRFATPRTGLLAALLFYSNPLVGVMSWKAGADLGVAFFQFLAVYALALGFEEAPRRRAWWLLSAVFTGFAMGTKYTAWPLALLLGLVMAWRMSGRPGWDRRELARSLAVYALATAAVLAVWPLINLRFYGNPVFPFYHEWFDPSAPPVDWRSLLKDSGRDWGSMFGSWSGFRDQFLLHPWHLCTQQYDSKSFGPVFLLGLPLLALARFKTEAERVVLACLLGVWGLWSLTSVVPRYFLPAYLLAAALYASAFERALSGAAKKIAYGLLAYVVVANFFWTAAWLNTYEAVDVVLGRQTADDYLSRPHPSYGWPYHACARFVGERLPPRARLLVVGDERGYYLKRDYAASTTYNESPLARYLRASSGPADLRRRLARDGFTHVLYNVAQLRALGTDRWYRLSAAEARLYEDFRENGLRLVFEDRAADPGRPAWCAVYEIR